MNEIRGTGVALITPFDKDKNIDTPALIKLVNYVIDGGVDYLVVMGTTAENPVLSNDEKKLVLETVIAANGNRKPIVFGIGGNHSTKVVEEIKTMNNYPDIVAFLSVTPYYNKPNQQGLYAHFEVLAQASKKPIILYNVPGRTGVNMLASTTLRIAHNFSNIVAIKEASGSIEQIMEIIEKKPDSFMVISGDDALTLPLIAVGVEGVISVVANAIPKHFSNMVRWALSDNYKEAKNIHYQVLEFCRLAFAEGNPVGIKNALAQLKIIQNEFRLPLVPASEALSAKIYNWLNNNMV
ncbi:MAG: 4-hydroxy-tetrahydrodipicolinate synthase [Bacteroidales bacterium]|nr:4-hydroxy-tetrahydrodipicolinate synthase [Bacteroidales bacterium]